MRRAITCVYCEPKSRMRIFECAEDVAMMCLPAAGRNAPSFPWLYIRVARPIHVRGDLPFAAHAPRQLLLHLLAGRPFVRTTRQPAPRPGEANGGSESLHRPRLEARETNARFVPPPPAKAAHGTARFLVAVFSSLPNR